jgi:hypothetical protein
MATTSAAGGGDLGAAEFLAKPVDFDHLKAQLRELPRAPD